MLLLLQNYNKQAKTLPDRQMSCQSGTLTAYHLHKTNDAYQHSLIVQMMNIHSSFVFFSHVESKKIFEFLSSVEHKRRYFKQQCWYTRKKTISAKLLLTVWVEFKQTNTILLKVFNLILLNLFNLICSFKFSPNKQFTTT